MHESWQKIYTSLNEYRAEIVRAILEENDLSPILVSKKDSTYHFGHYELYVMPENVLRAIKIIQDEIQFE
ncbi:MAG: hypothetical protein V4714_08985 [Bacteroidota bacterium]